MSNLSDLNRGNIHFQKIEITRTPNSKKNVKEFILDASTDGKKGNANLIINDNGKKQIFRKKLNKINLSHILNTRSLNRFENQLNIDYFPKPIQVIPIPYANPKLNNLQITRHNRPRRQPLRNNITRQRQMNTKTHKLSDDYDELERLFTIRKKLKNSNNINSTKKRRRKPKNKSKKSFFSRISDMF